jgi:hypothetical protein
MALAVYRVLRRTDEWQVERDGVVRSAHDLKADAIYVARWLALASQPSRVAIETVDGAVDAELSYPGETAPPGDVRTGGTLQRSAHFGQW